MQLSRRRYAVAAGALAVALSGGGVMAPCPNRDADAPRARLIPGRPRRVHPFGPA